VRLYQPFLGEASETFQPVYKNLAGPRENAETRDLACGAAATFTVALAPEIGLVKFYFTGKRTWTSTARATDLDP